MIKGVYKCSFQGSYMGYYYKSSWLRIQRVEKGFRVRTLACTVHGSCSMV